MSEEQLKAFLEKVKDDTGLQEKLKGAPDADAVVAIAKEAGFVISADDLQKTEISEEELESVSGGTDTIALCITVPLFGLGWAAAMQKPGTSSVRGVMGC